MNQSPFEIMRWESPRAPDREFLLRMMNREGLQPKPVELAAATHTPEMKFDRPLVLVPADGKIQVSFPGYGVIELSPGDILEIQPDVLHDVIVSSTQPAVILQAFKS
jgi:hypothetical protein